MPPLPSKLIKRLKNIFARADHLWDEKATAGRAGDISCRAGCFGCCIGLFEISLAEAALARSGVRRLDQEERKKIEAQALTILQRTAGTFPGDAEAGVLDPERTESQDDAYFAGVADTACPMLELPSGRCRIYEERPITCRTYGLPWKRRDQIVYPACTLNLVGAGEERQLEMAIDLDQLLSGDQELAEAGRGAGLPAGAETTLAHAIAGSAFREI